MGNQLSGKISIIVPVFRVEDYLEKCVNSIINQTYKNIEIILVDDGSDDNCPGMCDEFAREDSRIVVIHQENQGISAARNHGLNIATGDYICFIDSDDWVEPNMCEILLTDIIENEVDIVAANFWVIREDKKCLSAMPIKEKRIINDPVEIFKNYGESVDSIHVVAWNKLYKKKVFDEIRFPVGRQNEDCFIFAEVYSRFSRVYADDRYVYNYLQRSNSIIHSMNIIKKTDEIYAYIHNCDVATKSCPNAIPVFVKLLLRRYINWRKGIVFKACSDEEKKCICETDFAFKKAFRQYSNEIPLRHIFMIVAPDAYFSLKRLLKKS